jgi:DNA-binding transcriptional MerR regulator
MFLAPRDAARLLGISVSRLQQLDREGRFKSMRDSANRRLYDEETVIRFKISRKLRIARAQYRQPLAR